MWERLYTDFSIVLAGFGMTLGVSLLALVLTLLISLVGGLVRCSHARPPRAVYEPFSEHSLVRTDFLLLLRPRKGVVLSPFAVGCLGLALYTGAFVQAIPKQLSEAAMSQGFSYLQTMFHVIIPQAMKIALPSLTNQAAT